MELVSLIALFFIRREWDSNPREPLQAPPIFETGTFNHSDIPPCLLTLPNKNNLTLKVYNYLCNIKPCGESLFYQRCNDFYKGFN